MRAAEMQLHGKGVNRHEGVKRVLLLMELIQPLRRGATLKELYQDVSDELGQLSERTVWRDLSVLMALNIINKVDDR